MEDLRETPFKENAKKKNEDVLVSIMLLFKRHYILYSQILDPSFDFRTEDHSDEIAEFYMKRRFRTHHLTIGNMMRLRVEKILALHRMKLRDCDPDELLSFWERGDIYFPMAEMGGKQGFDLGLDPQTARVWEREGEGEGKYEV